MTEDSLNHVICSCEILSYSVVNIDFTKTTQKLLLNLRVCAICKIHARDILFYDCPRCEHKQTANNKYKYSMGIRFYFSHQGVKLKIFSHVVISINVGLINVFNMETINEKETFEI